MRLLVFTSIVIFTSIIGLLRVTPTTLSKPLQFTQVTASVWEVMAIDTMKYSRDMSREYLHDQNRAQAVIRVQLAAIADAGATHVAIGTPYDEEFLPVLQLWVQEARRRKLGVWFRGNWSGWEGWFEYAPISRTQHLEMTKRFIQNNSNLFKDGDIFTACPECENGLNVSLHSPHEVEVYRKFLIQEHQMLEEQFSLLAVHVQTNFNSMNGDVARLVMDEQTTAQLGGVITVDHYVASPEKMIMDMAQMAEQSNGRIVVGEFGVPIPDIHGSLSPEERALWLDHALELLAREPAVIGLNYWTSFGGSTALWRENGTPYPAAAVLKKHYHRAKMRERLIFIKPTNLINASIIL